MIRDIMTANETVTPNQKEINILKENFPSCFCADGTFDMVRFSEFLKDKIDISHEGYELKFLGKNYAKMLASLDTETVIVPDEAHNSLPENVNSENVYISGDNLDGLKHLLKSYAGQVKCIYIDPPYNTGSDGFVYNDKFNFTVEELVEKLSIDEEQSQRILDLTNRGSASHSAWLMFMYPRLQLAKDLLDKDGVIFISIDDNEQGNLKLLCDDIFSETNFVAQLVWEKKKKGSYLADSVTNIKEYILVYAKRKEEFSGLIGEINSEEETYPCVNASNGRDIRVIPAGIESKYRDKNFRMNAGEIISDTTMNLVLHSDLVIEDGVLAEELKIESNWRYGQDAMTEYALNKELYITRDLYLRRIVKEPRYKGLKDLLLRVGDNDESGYSYDVISSNLQKTGWGSNEDADEEQRLLFGEQSLMSYPKPVLLIMKLLSCLQKQDLLVVDFFSGSATTAEAAMRLNSRGMNIKTISIQLPENLDIKSETSTGDDKANAKKLISFLDKNNHPHTLDYLGIERILRSAKKIKEENPNTTADLGFKHYTLAEVSQNTLDKIERFDNSGYIIDTTVYDEFGTATILTTWLVHDNYGFINKCEMVDLAGYTAYWCENHLYLINPDLSEEAIKALVEKYNTEGAFNPQNIVLFGYSFNYVEMENLKTNVKILRDSEKNLKINLDIRY
ncbi:DNA (cytosine-5-)-methyltransferase [Peptoniphilus duerdenii ATCC BAA-1640]|uniref:DNA (Cytosine-5-)-methyltransferase n=1 Tax=Peptoniphilus duerdenii ATCC BAA-1640 TaxID=862517 RepID=E0NJ74_9FIRM|nr:site-specific DNA-methyltransferase [Peptoniphilus duerdenii]EFM26193.1 DNA (cytosine-5-)-methyltransferase [Peptoniphilus duerdenii ATCC BAA-1640]